MSTHEPSDKLAKGQAPDTPLGFYYHVPFCPRPCDFCSFYQSRPNREEVKAYLKGIEDEIAGLSLSRPVTTIYFGGGTPGMMSTPDLDRLCGSMPVRSQQPPREWTVEMAPSTINEEKVRMLRDRGITRMSMGIQSFDEALLEKMGRPLAHRKVLDAYETARTVGFDNINVDMIFAVPGQTEKMMLEDLEKAVALEPEHISLYCLAYEEDTALYESLSKGRLTGMDPDEEAQLYSAAWDFLEKSGFRQYEISNFARPGFESNHNLNTWKMREWIGVGPSSATQYQGFRYSHVPDFKQWLRGVTSGSPVFAEHKKLDARILVEDSVIFGLRMTDGIRPRELENRFKGFDLSFLEPLWNDLLEAGKIAPLDDGAVRLTKEGRLIADRIAVEVMQFFDAMS